MNKPVPNHSREDWRSERVTTPRAGWQDGAVGQQRVTERRVRNLLIGAECTVSTFRVCREAARLYQIFEHGEKAAAFKTPEEVLRFLATPTARETFRGVARRGSGHYYAQICVQRTQMNLGTYATADAAARAYDAFVLAHGLDRPLNFPAEQEAA